MSGNVLKHALSCLIYFVKYCNQKVTRFFSTQGFGVRKTPVKGIFGCLFTCNSMDIVNRIHDVCGRGGGGGAVL